MLTPIYEFQNGAMYEEKEKWMWFSMMFVCHRKWEIKTPTPIHEFQNVVMYEEKEKWMQ